MKVRELLTPLTRARLRRLCQKRALLSGGMTSDILERLARSYRGRFEMVLDDLRREDLMTIAASPQLPLDLPSGWRRLQVEGLRSALLLSAQGDAIDQDCSREGSRALSSQEFANDCQLYSTGTVGSVPPDVYRFDVGHLRREASAAKRITVISAYYVMSVLRDFLSVCKGEVRILLNGLGGSRLGDQVRELQTLEGELQERAANAQIRLGFARGVFHTKLYLFERARSATAWIGSANATAAGFEGHNEEILMRISPVPDAVITYARWVWAESSTLSKCAPAVNSLTAFYRTGMLYYKPYALLQKTYNPFRELMAALPREEKKKIAAFSSDFAEDEDGIGAFSIDRAHSMDQSHHELDVEEPKKDAPDVDKRPRLDFRRYAVETCYGYWVSEKFVDTVDSLLAEASERRKQELERFLVWLSDRESFVVEAFEAYLTEARETMDDRGVDWGSYEDRGVFTNTLPIKKRVRYLVAELSEAKRFKRLAKHMCHRKCPSCGRTTFLGLRLSPASLTGWPYTRGLRGDRRQRW